MEATLSCARSAVNRGSRTLVDKAVSQLPALDKIFHKLDAKWLKVADQKILKQTNAQYLTIKDAGAEFLKVDGTAANAQKLDGLQSGDFVQGHGNVLTGEVSAPANDQSLQVLEIPGLLEVSATNPSSGGETTLTLHNKSTGTLDYVNDETQGTIDPTRETELQISNADTTQIQVLLPAVQAVTLDVSQLEAAPNRLVTIQALIGNL